MASEAAENQESLEERNPEPREDASPERREDANPEPREAVNPEPPDENGREGGGEPLEGYQLLGELRGRRDGRCYIARRVEDGADALVVILSTPEGDERNALSHLAADTKLLIDHKHRNLVRILDGRWVDDDSFAVVSARVAAPTLRELLDRGEVLSTPRIAVILREVWSALGWAREQKVVHRAVTPDTLLLDPKSDRVLVSFTIRPLLATGRGDMIEDDARTIGRLAWSMLVRSADLPDEAGAPLRDLRPDLPMRVIEPTELLVSRVGDGSPLPQVLDYIGAIAMAESLMLGELETAHLQAIIIDEQMEERKAWEAQQRACENELREQTIRLAKEREELHEQVAAERAELAARRQELEESTAKLIADTERTHAERMRELEERTTREREEAERSFAKRQDALERAHAKQTEELERTHAKQSHDLERKYTRQTEEAEKQFAKRSSELEHTYAKLQKEFEREVGKHRESAAAEQQALERDAAKRREAIAAERAALERDASRRHDEITADRAATERELEKARVEFDRAMQKERAEFERWSTAERSELEAARGELQRTVEQEVARLESERANLAQERTDIDAYWARTEARIQEIEATHACVEEGELERELEVEEEEHRGRREPVAAGERDQRDEEIKGVPPGDAPARGDREVPRIVERDESSDDKRLEGIPLPPALLALVSRGRHEEEDGPARAEESRTRHLSPPGEGDAGGPPWSDRARRVLRSRWTMPGAGLVLVAVTATAVAIVGSDGGNGGDPHVIPVVVDSAAGAVEISPRSAPIRSVVPLPESAMVSTVRPVEDGAARRRQQASEERARRERQERAQREREARAAAPVVVNPPVSRVDTVVLPTRDSVVSTPPADSGNFFSRLWNSINRSDSVPRDTAVRQPVSTRPDTLPRPDSLSRR